MSNSERMLVLLGRIIEGNIESFFRDNGPEDVSQQAHLKEALLTNLLVNTLLYETVLDRDLGKISKEEMTDRFRQRIEYLIEQLPVCANYQIKQHLSAKEQK